MAPDGEVDLVTGAFSYSGSHIAARLLDAGREVRTLTFHPDRPHPLGGRVDARRYRFDDPAALARSLEGVTNFYNTYWVRFDHGPTTFTNAIENSRALFSAARRAGVERVIHISITNPSLESPLPYFLGKALVERALAEEGVPYSVVRPTLIFGGERDVLTNNIAWILRRLPVFAIPGDGRYRVQPVHAVDVARICVEQASAHGDVIVDAAGPETMTFDQLVETVRSTLGSRAAIVHVPSPVMSIAARALGALVRDVVLTKDEIEGLTSGLLESNSPPLGQISFTDWLTENADSVGRAYANELKRHFVRSAPA